MSDAVKTVSKIAKLYPGWSLSAKDALKRALRQKPRGVIVIGTNENGQEFDHTNIHDTRELLWLLERARARLINAGNE